MAKLTLHVPDELVAAAKKEAADRSVSVSKLVSDFFRGFRSGDDTEGEAQLGPITKQLLGSLEEIQDPSGAYAAYQEGKQS